jgi:hypothetical protein
VYDTKIDQYLSQDQTLAVKLLFNCYGSLFNTTTSLTKVVFSWQTMLIILLILNLNVQIGRAILLKFINKQYEENWEKANIIRKSRYYFSCGKNWSIYEGEKFFTKDFF